MKKFLFISLVLALFCMMLTGCATTRVSTEVGVKIGDTYQESAAMGMVSAEKSIKAWPYISGQIKGLLASNYELEIPVLAKEIIKALDELAAKETLTDEEKGFVIGSFCRLEAVAIQEGWDRYGGEITGFFARLAG